MNVTRDNFITRKLYPSHAALVRDMRATFGANLTDTPKLTGQTSWALPARLTCPTGDKLARVAGTPCFGCYAATDLAQRKALQAAGAITKASTRISMKQGDNDIIAAAVRRWHALERITELPSDSAEYLHSVDCMAAAIVEGNPNDDGYWYHRWHPFGDVFSLAYGRWIAAVARRTDEMTGGRCLHWLPTQERATAGAVDWPWNVAVRISSAQVDRIGAGACTSVVFTGDVAPAGAVRCRCETAGACGACRACYMSESVAAHIGRRPVTVSAYRLH